VRYWFDTEFHDTGAVIHLISIGVVAEDGRTYYAVSADYDRSMADDWLKENVLAKLGSVIPKSRNAIHAELLAFFSVGGVPDIWADFCEYDWIVLRQLFGTITQWPAGWPWICMDIEQLRIFRGAPKFPNDSIAQHNALDDAKHAREKHLYIEAWKGQ
jgi:hypothetical protein